MRKPTPTSAVTYGGRTYHLEGDAIVCDCGIHIASATWDLGTITKAIDTHLAHDPNHAA